MHNDYDKLDDLGKCTFLLGEVYALRKVLEKMRDGGTALTAVEEVQAEILAENAKL